MTDVIKLFGFAIVVSLLAITSCMKDDLSEISGNTFTTIISLDCSEDGNTVRSVLDASWKVSWEAGDPISYYTGRYISGGTSTSYRNSGLYTVQKDTATVNVPVTYKDGDNRIAFLTKGSSVGDIVVPTTLESFTITDGVPDNQDGKFASSYIAAGKGNLLELADGDDNLILTPLQAFIRFKLSSLTVGDKTVNKIVVTGKTSDASNNICGDLKLTTGTDSYTWTSALDGTAGTEIKIDKTSSKFNVDEYIYVAVLPYQYSSITLNLYNGTARLASVPVKQKTSGNIDARHGKVVDIGEINAHKKVVGTMCTLYPVKAAITPSRSKKLWMKIEPSDFNGTVKWTSTSSKITIADDSVENEKDLGECHVTTISPNGISAGTTVTITCTVYSAENSSEVIDTKTCEIEYGDFLDLGLKHDSKRCLWAYTQLVMNDTRTKYSMCSVEKGCYTTSNTTKDLSHFQWGAVEPWNINKQKYGWFPTGTDAPTGNASGEFKKYNSADGLTILQTVNNQYSGKTTYNTIDDAARLWNSAANLPNKVDCVELMNKCVYSVNATGGYATAKSDVVGYRDVEMYIQDRGLGGYSSDTDWTKMSGYMFWVGECDAGCGQFAPIFSVNVTTLKGQIGSTERVCVAALRPVKYVE